MPNSTFDRDIIVKKGTSILAEGGAVIAAVADDGTVTSAVGDITSIAAGDGLTGGGSSGAVSLAVQVDDSTIEINSDTLRIKDGGVTSAKLDPNAINANTIANVGEGDAQINVTKVADIPSATVKALLDGNANTLNLNLPTGTYVYDFVIWTQTAAGSAGTVKVGTDANWNDASNDDAFVAAHDLNTPGTYKMSVLDAASTPVAPSASSGIFASAEADFTIQSSADLSASSWAGGIKVFYH